MKNYKLLLYIAMLSSGTMFVVAGVVKFGEITILKQAILIALGLVVLITAWWIKKKHLPEYNDDRWNK